MAIQPEVFAMRRTIYTVRKGVELALGPISGTTSFVLTWTEIPAFSAKRTRSATMCTPSFSIILVRYVHGSVTLDFRRLASDFCPAQTIARLRHLKRKQK